MLDSHTDAASQSPQREENDNHISTSTVNLIRRFCTQRHWDQYHSPENLAKSICIEAAELLECYQWTPGYPPASPEHVQDELADVLTYCIQMSDRLGVDMDSIIRRKLAKTEKKYPVTLVRDHPEAAQERHDEVRRREGAAAHDHLPA